MFPLNILPRVADRLVRWPHTARLHEPLAKLNNVYRQVPKSLTVPRTNYKFIAPLSPSQSTPSLAETNLSKSLPVANTAKLASFLGTILHPGPKPMYE